MLSAKALYDYFEGKGSLHPGIIGDLFGYLNWSKHMKENKEDTISLFLGIFKGLYYMDVSYKEIYRCFLKNRLDDLIHTKYSINKSGYYKEFCEKRIKIGDTFMIDEDEDEDEEQKPFIYSHIQKPYHYNQIKVEIAENSSGVKDDIILNKIKAYKEQDKAHGRDITCDYVTINDVKKMLFKQEKKCYVCGDNVITEEWAPSCLYQFTLDRIDNNLPHNKNNVLISCYYCNCFGWQADETDICYKLCKNKCHTIKRNITRTRYNVSSDEIKQLLIE